MEPRWPKRTPALDRIDVKILAALQRDGRSTIQKLAEAVGLSPRASLERVRRLEAAGVIAGYQAVVELGRLSRPVNVFAEIILEKHANRGRFEKRLTAIEEVVECWEVSGTVDYLARFVCADLAAYEELTSALIDDARPRRGAHRQPRRAASDPPLQRLSDVAARAPNSGKTLTTAVSVAASRPRDRRIRRLAHSTSAAHVAAAT